MDKDAIRSLLEQAVPFNRHIGLRILDVGDEAKVALPEADELKNHVGSQHAAALFAAGEAASGAAVVGALADHMATVTPLARSAEIRYRKLALGPITASARLGRRTAEILEELRRDSRVEFDVTVEMTDGAGVAVAEMTVRWHLRRNA